MNYVDQQWRIPEGVIRLRVEAEETFPAQTFADLSEVVIAIEQFVTSREDAAARDEAFS